MAHVPVLLKEVIDGLAPKAGETFVDGTLGGGGHSRAIGGLLGSGGHLIAIDVDKTAHIQAASALEGLECKVTLIEGNFRHIKKLVGEVSSAVDGVLLDLGFRSDQLEAGKGLSFQKDEPLSMTLGDPAKYPFTALEIVNEWQEESIADLIYYYGEEHFARRIAKAIVEARVEAPITTTFGLVEVIEGAVPVWYRYRRVHPATRTFQALRIAVNDEIRALEEGLEGAWSILKSGGRLGVISFHSLEARVVKRFNKHQADQGLVTFITKKAIEPSAEEVAANPRARSAQLRIIKKI